MSKLRAELRLISTERGDIGSPEARGRIVDEFVGHLEKLLHPAALQTFAAYELREVFVAYAAQAPHPNPAALIMSRLSVRPSQCLPRDLPSVTLPPKVVSLR